MRGHMASGDVDCGVKSRKEEQQQLNHESVWNRRWSAILKGITATLLEPVPPPSPYWGCSEDRILPLPIPSLHRRQLCWVHITISYIDGFSGKRRGSRRLMRAGFSSSENSPLTSWTGDFLQAPSPVTSSVPSARYGAPSRTPSIWHPRLYHPFPSGTPSNHISPPSSPTHILRQGSVLRLVTADIPLSNTQGFSRPHLLLFTRA